MTNSNMDLTELLQKHDQGDLLRSIAEAVLQLMMETDVEGVIGAGRPEGRTQGLRKAIGIALPPRVSATWPPLEPVITLPNRTKRRGRPWRSATRA